MPKLTKRGQGWLLGDAPIATDGMPVWMRALGLPWRRVTLRVVNGELFVYEGPPPMPAVEIGSPLPMMCSEDVPEPYPPPGDAEWAWEPPLDDEQP